MEWQDEYDMREQTREVYRQLDANIAAELVRGFSFDDRTFAEQYDADYEEPTWRIDNLHIVGANTTITAHAKTGKTTLMMNLIRSMTDGVPFLDQRVIAPEGNVAYLNMELTQNMALDWMGKAGVVNRDRLFVQHLRGQYFPLYNDELEKRFIDWLHTHSIEVLIIDPVGRLMRGWPGRHANAENDSGVASELQHKFDLIKLAAGVQDLFLPIHTGHEAASGGSLRSRGSVMWLDWPDHLWGMWKKEIVGEDIRHFDAEGRDVEFGTKLLSFDPSNEHYGIEDDAEAVLERGRAQAVVKALAKLGGVADATTLRSALKGVGNGKASDAYEAAEKRGWIVVDKEGGKTVRRLNKAEEYVRQQIELAELEER